MTTFNDCEIMPLILKTAGVLIQMKAKAGVSIQMKAKGEPDIEMRHIDQIQSGWIINPDEYTALDLINGLVPLYESELEAVEEFAADNNLIGSEMELSELFDDQYKDFVREHCLMNNGSLDHVMINEEFNNWTDSLCKDGVIHMEQYNNYCYVGKWSDD